MFYQTEEKPQGWRAVAVFEDRGERLIYLGRSSTQVRTGFAQAYFEVLDDEERDHVRSMDPESLADPTPLLIRLLGYHSQMEFEPDLNDHRRIPVPGE